MNKTEYMKALERELRHLPKSDKEEILLYYKEYFEDAGVEHEADVIAELGEPKTLAAQVLKETAMKGLEKPEKSAHGRLSILWIVMLAICAAPIGLPLIIAVIAVGLALVISVAAVVFSVGLCGVLFGIIGIGSMVASIFILPMQFASGICIIGVGLLSLGLGLLTVLVTGWLCRVSFSGMGKGAKRLLSGGKKA